MIALNRKAAIDCLVLGSVFYADSLTESDPWYRISGSRRKRLSPKAKVQIQPNASCGTFSGSSVRYHALVPDPVRTTP